MELATARQSPVHRLWTFLWIPLPEGSAGWPLPVGNQGRKPTRQRLVIPTRGTPLGISQRASPAHPDAAGVIHSRCPPPKRRADLHRGRDIHSFHNRYDDDYLS